MPFSIRPFCRFPVQCAVMYNAGLVPKLSLAYFFGFWSLISLLVVSSVPVSAEWVTVGGNDQAGLALAQLSRTQILDSKPAAVDPVPQTASWWTTQHEHTLARIRQGEIDLLLIGDSITQGWANEGRRIWDAYIGCRRAVNLGFNGNGTEHVLWRLDHGEIDKINRARSSKTCGERAEGPDCASPMSEAPSFEGLFSEDVAWYAQRDGATHGA